MAYPTKLARSVKVGEVKNNLAPIPIQIGLYAVYEGIEENFWKDPKYINDHPALVGLHGWLPLTANVSLDIAKATADKAYTSWNIAHLWGYVGSSYNLEIPNADEPFSN